jgi:hypothetical protein
MLLAQGSNSKNQNEKLRKDELTRNIPHWEKYNAPRVPPMKPDIRSY